MTGDPGFLELEGGDCLQKDIQELLGVMEVPKPDCGGGCTMVYICQYVSICVLRISQFCDLSIILQ